MKAAQRRERDKLEAEVVADALKLYQVPSIKLKPGAQTGWPDQLFFIPGGRSLLIEFKWPGYEMAPRQYYIHKMLKGLGYDVELHTRKDEALRAIERAKELGAKELSKGRR